MWLRLGSLAENTARSSQHRKFSLHCKQDLPMFHGNGFIMSDLFKHVRVTSEFLSGLFSFLKAIATIGLAKRSNFWSTEWMDENGEVV